MPCEVHTHHMQRNAVLSLNLGCMSQSLARKLCRCIQNTTLCCLLQVFWNDLKMLPGVIEGIVRTAVQGLDAEMPLRYNATLFQDIEYYLPSRARVLQSQASCHTVNK